MDNYEFTDLLPLLEETISYAASLGADQSAASAFEQRGLSASVRQGGVETLENARERHIGISVYRGRHRGDTSTSDFSTQGLRTAVAKAWEIARFTADDPFAGLPDPECHHANEHQLDLFHPWPELTPAAAIEIARNCEAKGLAHSRISNSEGASIDSSTGVYAQANSQGFSHQQYRSHHSLSLALIAESSSGMQRDFSYTVARDWKDLASADTIADDAITRTVSRLDPATISTLSCPVLFPPEMARGLIAALLDGLKGMAQYQKTTFLYDCLHQQLFPSFMDIREQPHLPRALGSQCYDAEGVPVYNSPIVEGGTISRYLLSSYSARALGMSTTANAGGFSNICVKPGSEDYQQLIQRMQRGIIVTEMMGQGLNALTGDYSRGASGYWVENGVIQYPIHEFTLAGNMKDIFANIIAAGTDIDSRSPIRCPSLLIDGLKAAGNA